MVCTLLAGVNVVAFAADDNDLVVSVHSFYNDATKGGDGEHLYTKDLDEMSWLSSLPTWNDEDEAWKAPVSSSLAVYRVYNPNSGEHHYAAADEAEWLVSQGWTQEKIAFYSDDNMGVPIYRLWNGGEGVGSHYYTTDEGEAAYLASIGWTAEGVNFYGVKEDEPVVKEMTAVQTGANEITVTTTTSFTGLEEFAVYHGLIEDVVVDCDFVDDKNAVITIENAIEAEEYTVMCSDEEYEEAYFDGETAEVKYFAFNGEELIATDGQLLTGIVGYATLDQFGDYIYDDSIEFKVANGQYVIHDDADEDGVGQLLIASPGATYDAGEEVWTGTPWRLGDQVTVNAVYADSTSVETAVLTVSATSVVENMMVGDLTLNPEAVDYDEMVDARLTSALLAAAAVEESDFYFLPILAQDQYGNTLNAETLKAMCDPENQTLYITPSNGGASTVAFAIPALMEDIPQDVLPGGFVALPVMGNGTAFGTGVINFLSTSGFATSKEIAVAQNEMTDTIDIEVENLQAGKAKEISIYVENQYGEPILLTDDIMEMEPGMALIEVENDTKISITDYYETVSTIEIQNGTFGVDPETGMLTVTGTAGKALAIITTESATHKAGIIQRAIEPAATPKYVAGLAPTIETVYATTASTINVSLPNAVVFLDSDKDLIDNTGLAKVDYNDNTKDFYYIVERVTAAEKACTEFNDVTGEISFKANAQGPVTDKYAIYLYQKGVAKALSSANFTVTLAGAPVSFRSETDASEGTLYVGQGSTDKATITVYGTDKAGNEYVLPTQAYTLTVGNGLVANSGSTITGEFDLQQVGLKEGQATVTVYVKGTAVATAKVNYSNATPEAVAVLVYEATNVNDPTTYTLYTGTTVAGVAGKYLGAPEFATGQDIGLIYADGHIAGEDASGYVVSPIDQYMQPIEGTEVTLMDSQGLEVNNLEDNIEEELMVGDSSDFVIAIVENGDVDLTFTITGVTLYI